MALITCGINYQTAPLAVRERLVFQREVLQIPLQDLVAQGNVQEAAILSTCNRTELYCQSEQPLAIAEWLHRWHRLPKDELTPYLYFYTEQAAVRHIMRVASGLDSMVLGEPQILGQMKQAVDLALQAGTLGKYLQRLFQHVFSVTKKVRTDTAIGTSAISIAYSAIGLAKRIFADLKETSVLLIGAGETIALAARHLRENGVKHLFIANRTTLTAEQLARQFGGKGIGLADIPAYLPYADIVLTATASTLPILGKGSVETALKQRKRRPILMVDLAIPRDIEPEVGGLADVYLYTVDDLQGLIEENLESRQRAARQAEQIIDLQATHFMRSLQSLDSVPIIRAYREKVCSIQQEELHKALKRLEHGVAPAQVLEDFSRLLVNKLLHTPTTQLRQAAYQNQTELLAYAKQLLDP